jgi:hypothetical protein
VQSTGVVKPLVGNGGSGINRFLTRSARQLTMWLHVTNDNRMLFGDLTHPIKLARRLLKEAAVK